MRIASILTPECVLPQIEAGSKTQVLAQLTEPVARVAKLDQAMLTEVLMGRERLGSTGIGDGIAIPHGKVAGLKRITAALALSPQGIDFAALDGKPCHIFFAVLVPSESVGGHLKALARISTLLKSEALRRRMLQAADALAAYRELLADDRLLSE